MRFALAVLGVAVLSTGPMAQQKAEVPKDSVEIVARGCLKDRILTTTQTPRFVDGDELDVPVGHFQISGKKPILKELKAHDREEVEIVGYVRKADLREPGISVPGGRVVIGPGRGGDRYSLPTPPERRVVLLQATSIRPLDKSCER